MSNTPEDQNDNAGLIKLSLVLTERGRSKEGRETLAALLERYNWREAGRGFATMSLLSSPEDLKELGPDITPLPPLDSREWVGGGNAAPEPDVIIPEDLRPFVQAISISPQARHFGREK